MKQRRIETENHKYYLRHGRHGFGYCIMQRLKDEKKFVQRRIFLSSDKDQVNDLFTTLEKLLQHTEDLSTITFPKTKRN